MAGSADRAAEAINRHFLLEHPLDVVERIEQMGPDEAAPALVDQPAEVLAPLWPRLAPNLAAALMAKLPDRLAKELLGWEAEYQDVTESIRTSWAWMSGPRKGRFED